MPTIQPADVHATVLHLHAELEPVRAELGRPRDDRARYQMSGAAPREVYFAARALLARASRLAVEHTGELGAEPPAHTVSSLAPAHVLAIVQAAQGCVRRVRARLGLTDAVAAPPVDPARQPSDCLNAILLVNRQLDRLLARPIAPGDVDGQLALAAAYLQVACDAKGVTVAPAAFERRKRPGDVHARILAALRALRPLVTVGGATMVEPGESPIGVDDILPSDCYDVASLVLGELAHVQAAHELAVAVVHVPDPGPRLPAHCYQRAAQIEAGATALARATR